MNAVLMFSTITKIGNSIVAYLRTGALHKEIHLFNFDLWTHLWNVSYYLVSFCVGGIALPIFVFMALYGKSLLGITDKGIQYFIGAAVIISSRRFMVSIAKFPVVGGKVYMLTKAMRHLYNI